MGKSVMETMSSSLRLLLTLFNIVKDKKKVIQNRSHTERQQRRNKNGTKQTNEVVTQMKSSLNNARERETEIVDFLTIWNNLNCKQCQISSVDMKEEIYCKIGHFSWDATIQLSNDCTLKFAFSSFSLSFVSICLVLIIFVFLQENAFFHWTLKML